jgi:hypothetical protein
MSARSRRVNVLWLDDDLRPRDEGITPERARLQPWLRWFKKNENRIKLIEAYTIVQFAEILEKNEASQPDDDSYIDVLLIDLMLRESSLLPETFENIGFPDEKIIPMEAGIQFVKLIHAKNAPAWLSKYKYRKLAVLTTLTDATFTITGHLRSSDAVTLIYKRLEIVGDELAVPSKGFSEYFSKLS